MSAQPRYFDEANKKLWEAVDEYFTKAGDDSAQNTYDARNIISRVGKAFTIVVFPWVAERIEREGIETANMAAFGASNDLLDLRIFIVAEKCMKQLRDVVNTYGHEAGPSLVAHITTGGDEDEQAIAAYLLASYFSSSLEPMPKEMAKSLLQSFFDLVEGTSCKMALAWALYNLGVKKYWEELVYGNYFIMPEFLAFLEECIKNSEPKLKKQEIKDRICREVATGDHPELTFPIPEAKKRGLLRILAIDIASNGRAFKNAPKWTRKVKTYPTPF